MGFYLLFLFQEFMKNIRRSYFKDEFADKEKFLQWVDRLENHNNRTYGRHEVKTALGKTHVWSLNAAEIDMETLIVFPGARTTSLIWDLDRGLDNLRIPVRIFLVETNGLPNLSDGSTPDIKSLEYGEWAAEVMDKLQVKKAYVAGASFGGLICMKLGIVQPEMIKAAFLLNPACLQWFSLGFKNLYYNLLPIIRTSAANVSKFLDKAVFNKPNHQLSDFSEKMLVDYEVFAISRYKDNTQKPYFMGVQLEEVKVDTFVLLGDKDLLFPYHKSLQNAEKLIRNLKEIKVFADVGHGIETYAPALAYIGEKIEGLNRSTSK